MPQLGLTHGLALSPERQELTLAPTCGPPAAHRVGST